MAKRFIDTEIFDKTAFNKASMKIKLLTIFVFAKADCVGVFKMAMPLVSVYIGEPISEGDILSIPMDIEKIKDGVYWLKNFCDFQYGELTWSCKPHRKYIDLLKKHGLSERVSKGFRKGLETLQEQEQEQEKEKEEEIKGEYEGGSVYPERPQFTLNEVKNIARICGLSDTEAEACFYHYDAQGWVRSNGQQIVNLRSALMYWKNHQHEFAKPEGNLTHKEVQKRKLEENRRREAGL